MLPKLIFVQLDYMRKFFVVSQSAYELSNSLCIFRSRGSNHEVVMWLEVEWRLSFAGLGPTKRKSKVSIARSSHDVKVPDWQANLFIEADQGITNCIPQ